MAKLPGKGETSLPEKRMVYCDVVREYVPCVLVRGQHFFDMSADTYRCERLDSGEPPCDPCSHYSLGFFVPIPPELVDERGKVNVPAWLEAVDARVSIPVTTLNRFFKNKNR